jgi:hypothetical protein
VTAQSAIVRLRELRAKATPTPWSAKKEAFDDDTWERQYVYHAIPDGEMPVAFPLGGTREDANAAAIVAAMNALPALLGCAEALQHLLRHSGIADVDARDKDKQDNDIERIARAALQALAEGGGE